MKYTLFFALIILAVIPASAQEAPTPNCAANSDAVAALAQDYAAGVDGLLRNVHASLQNISEEMGAGRLTPERAQKLKLAATRDMISRLDAMAAVYDARIESQDQVDLKSESVTGDASNTPQATHANTNGTVSVEKLKREAAAALGMRGTAEVTR